MTTSTTLGDDFIRFKNTGFDYGTLTGGATDGLITLSSNAGNVRLAGLADPSSAQDAATKNYVDERSWKQPVIVATTASGTLSTDFENGDTVDGVVIATGQRILIKNQSTASENGIYTVNASGAPTRAADLDTGSSAASIAVFVEQGTGNADKGFLCTSNTGSDTVGTDSLSFTEFTGGGGGGGSPGGADTQVQYNNSNSFGAAESFTFNKSTSAPTLGIGSDNTSTTAVLNIGTGTSITSSTLNMGDNTSSSTIDSQGTGTFAIQSAGTGSLFDTNTTSNITIGTSLTSGTITIGNSGTSSGLIDIDGGSCNIDIGLVSSGRIRMGNESTGGMIINCTDDLVIGKDSTNMIIGNTIGGGTTQVEGNNIILGSSSLSSTTSVDIKTSNTSRSTITNGNITNTVPIYAPDGSDSAPSYSFNTDTDSGIHLPSDGVVRIGTAGSRRVDFSSVSASYTVPIRNGNGTAAAPSYSFNADSDSGMYSIGANNLGFSVNGTKVIDIDEDYVNYTGALSYFNSYMKTVSNANQSIGNSTSTGLTTYWNSSLSVDVGETGSSEKPTYSNGVFTLKKQGVYLVHASVNFANNSTGLRSFWVQGQDSVIYGNINNTALSGSDTTMSITAFVYRSVDTDYTIQAYVFQNSGGSLNVNVDSNRTFEVYRLC